MKKTGLMVLFILLLPFFAQPNDAATPSLGEQLDQQQTEINMQNKIYGSNWLAQSFKPTLGGLTRLELCLSRQGNPSNNLTISVRGGLTEEDITIVQINPVNVSTEPFTWVEIDITNVTVTVEKTYYIICRTKDGDRNNSFIWYGGTNNSYKRGIAYTSENNGSTWEQQVFNDYAFKTYGIGMGLEFTYIYGTFGGEIKFGIKNSGTQSVKDITVNMYIKGLVFIGKRYQHTFKTTLSPGEELRSSVYPIIGLGPAEITFTASSVDTPKATTEKRDAFLLPFYVYIPPQQ